jgi:hypothetical protein
MGRILPANVCQRTDDERPYPYRLPHCPGRPHPARGLTGIASVGDSSFMAAAHSDCSGQQQYLAFAESEFRPVMDQRTAAFDAHQQPCRGAPADWKG